MIGSSLPVSIEVKYAFSIRDELRTLRQIALNPNECLALVERLSCTGVETVDVHLKAKQFTPKAHHS